jgi:hypothetical protein
LCSTSSTSGGGLFSGASGSVVAQGFGVGQTTPVKSGFGAAPAFGSPPAFGALAAPSSQVFGAAPSVFGASSGTAPATVFGSSIASDVPTFGSMGGGGGSTFGNLSHQGPFILFSIKTLFILSHFQLFLIVIKKKILMNAINF